MSKRSGNTTGLDELMPGDKVRHSASGRVGTVLQVASRWGGAPAAEVDFGDGERPHWIPRAVLSREH